MEGWHEVMFKIIEHSGESFYELSNLPGLNYFPTFILIDLIKTHNDYKN